MSALLSIGNLTKTFPGDVALDQVDFEVGRGETHALLGQNGSGKSTLIKILAGYHQPDPGWTAEFGMIPLELGNGRAAMHAGLRFVHQDLGLVESVDTVENLALGFGYQTAFGGRISWRKETERATELLADLGFANFDVRIPVAALSPAQRTAVAIARALQGWEEGVDLLVLDEPTSSLPAEDVGLLFDAIRRLHDRGISVLYVTHLMDEVFEIAQRVTVLRDGRRISTVPIEELDHESLVELIVGHKVEAGAASLSTRSAADPVLSLQSVSGHRLAELSIDVVPGEVVGVAGITGSGREDVVGLTIGQIPRDGGRVTVNGKGVRNYDPRAAIRSGMSFVPADRIGQGTVPLMNVRENLTLSDLRSLWKRGRLSRRAEISECDKWIAKLSIKTPSPETAIGALSGGNQQKVLFGKGLRLDPTVLVLDEPTRGIDVGAKEEIHRLIDQLVSRGDAVLVVSTDTEELVRLCHRVIVLTGGRQSAEITGSDINDERIEHAQLQT
jgi:ribose transport system ATP-binding protein